MSNLMLVEVGEKIEQVLINGDLKPLSAEERVKYYNAVCKSLGLNPMTKPFEYVTLNNKLTLYARKDATDQLRRTYKVSIDSVDTKQVGDLYLVTVTASIGDRKDSATGAVNTKGLGGESLANALMKAETKAKRRVTLSICGLGFLDETEVEDATETVVKEKIVDASKRFEEPPKAALPETQEQGEKFIAVQTAFDEREKRERIKSLGFKWNPELKTWIYPDDDETASILSNESIDFKYIFLEGK